MNHLNKLISKELIKGLPKLKFPQVVANVVDASMFGVYNDNFSLYIKHEYFFEINHGGQCLSIFVIQL